MNRAENEPKKSKETTKGWFTGLLFVVAALAIPLL